MKVNVAVLFGGKSVEHEISVISALQAISNIDSEKYNVIPIYITRSGSMYSGELIADIENYKSIPDLLKKSLEVFMVREADGVFVHTLCGKKLFKQKKIRIDVAFPIVHGLNVEDGTIAGFLHLLDLPYVGCDVLSSALGMDKYMSKIILRENGIPVLDCVYFSRRDWYTNTESTIKNIESSLQYPIIVKPVDLGSSVGISIARDRAGLTNSLELAFTFSDRVITEPAIVALQEINCSVLGTSESARASECEEPLNAGEILSYQDKYLSGNGKSGTKTNDSQSDGMASLQRRIPAGISPEMRENIRETAVKAFKALGASGIVRIDFMIDKSTGKFYLNEVNTIPGSLAFYLWEPLGMSYKELLTELINLALKRKRDEDELTFTFETNVLSQSKSMGVKK